MFGNIPLRERGPAQLGIHNGQVGAFSAPRPRSGAPLQGNRSPDTADSTLAHAAAPSHQPSAPQLRGIRRSRFQGQRTTAYLCQFQRSRGIPAMKSWSPANRRDAVSFLAKPGQDSSSTSFYWRRTRTMPQAGNTTETGRLTGPRSWATGPTHCPPSDSSYWALP